MQSATIFSKSLGGWKAPLWPAVILVCLAAALVFLNMTTNKGLAWAVEVPALRDISDKIVWLLIAVSVLWFFVVGFMATAFGRVAGEDSMMFLISVILTVIAAFLMAAGLAVAGRSPPTAIGQHAEIRDAIASALPGDPVANWLQRKLEKPTYAGLEQGASLIQDSLDGAPMERAMVSARIIGLDDMAVVKRIRARGWMTVQERNTLQDEAVRLIKNSSHGKSVAWQAAALTLADGSFSEPLAIRVDGRGQ